MKLVKCEMHKVALAALVLGVFSLSPNANAGVLDFLRRPAAAPSAASVVGDVAPAPRVAPAPSAADPGVSDNDASDFELATSNDGDGASLARMRSLSAGSNPGFGIQIKDGMVYMTGAIPRKCAMGSSFSMTSVPGVDGKPGQHQIKFVPGENCDKPSADKAMVKLGGRGLFGPGRAIPDASMDGDICMAHSENGLDSCDVINNAKFVSQNSILKDAADKQSVAQKKKDADEAKRAADLRKQKEDAFVAKLNILCKQGDFVGFGAEIEAAKSFLGDVTQILSKVDGLKQKYYVEQIKKAKDVDSVKDAYQSYLDAAEAAGWDTDDVTNQYADRRVEMLNTEVADSSKSAESRSRSIRELASDLRDMDLMDKAHKNKLGAAYVNLANSVREAAGTDAVSKYDEAAKYYNESLQYADADTKVKIDIEIEKMYAEAADQCLADVKENGKSSKIKECQNLAQKAKKSMDVAMKAQSHIKADGSLEALAAMKQEKIAKFGQDGMVAAQAMKGYDGSSVNVNVRGGSWDASVYTTFAQTQQNFLTQMMNGGAARNPSGTSGGGSIFQ